VIRDLGIASLSRVSPAAVYAAVVANNVIVAAKKVEKTARKVTKSAGGGDS
jgi:hypothetical protein